MRLYFYMALWLGFFSQAIFLLENKTKMSKEEINQLAEELKLIKKKLRISEQDVFRLAAEKIDLQDTIKELLNQNKDK